MSASATQGGHNKARHNNVLSKHVGLITSFTNVNSKTFSTMKNKDFSFHAVKREVSSTSSY